MGVCTALDTLLATPPATLESAEERLDAAELASDRTEDAAEEIELAAVTLRGGAAVPVENAVAMEVMEPKVVVVNAQERTRSWTSSRRVSKCLLEARGSFYRCHARRFCHNWQHMPRRLGFQLLRSSQRRRKKYSGSHCRHVGGHRRLSI